MLWMCWCLILDIFNIQKTPNYKKKSVTFDYWVVKQVCLTTKRHGLLQDVASQQAGMEDLDFVEGDDLLTLPGLITFPGSSRPTKL